MEIGLIISLLFLLLTIVFLVLWLQQREKNNGLVLKNNELIFQQKSLQVKYGKNWEQFVPLMADFEKVAKKENAVFIGMPIDYVVFEDDAIKFVEVKTGSSTLSKKQKNIKNLIEQKKVEWHELRF